MASYTEIKANNTWFLNQTAQLEELATKLGTLGSNIQYMVLADDAWPADLQTYKAKYESIKTTVSGKGQIGYGTGAERLQTVADNLEVTRKDYLNVEAKAQEEISTQILELLDQ